MGKVVWEVVAMVLAKGCSANCLAHLGAWGLLGIGGNLWGRFESWGQLTNEAIAWIGRSALTLPLARIKPKRSFRQGILSNLRTENCRNSPIQERIGNCCRSGTDFHPLSGGSDSPASGASYFPLDQSTPARLDSTLDDAASHRKHNEKVPPPPPLLLSPHLPPISTTLWPFGGSATITEPDEADEMFRQES